MTFIKFIEMNGSVAEEHYVNATQISEATYRDETGPQLTLFFGDRPGGEGVDYVLRGQEAIDGLAVIKALRRKLLAN